MAKKKNNSSVPSFFKKKFVNVLLKIQIEIANAIIIHVHGILKINDIALKLITDLKLTTEIQVLYGIEVYILILVFLYI